MKQSIFSVVVALGMFFSLSVPVHAEGIEMRGTARDSSFRPLENADIIVYKSTDNQKVLSTQTDEYGQYLFSLPQGTYNLQLVHKAEGKTQSYIKNDLQVNASMMQDLAFDPAVGTVAINTVSSSVDNFGLLPSIIVLEVLVVGLGFLAYILWRRQTHIKRK